MATFLRDPARNVLCETGTGPTFNVGGVTGPSTQSGLVPEVPMSEDEKRIRRDLFSPHSKWASAKLVSLQFSTVQGCHAMQDRKSNNIVVL